MTALSVFDPGLIRCGWLDPGKRYDHPERRRLRLSPARFKWCAGGRRSGKTVDALDHIILGHGPRDPRTGMPRFRGALTVGDEVEDPTFVVGGPTYGMLEKIWWGKLKRRVPLGLVDAKSESDMWIRYRNGATIYLIGMDAPQRAEGIAIDGLVGDEFAYWKPKAYEQSLRPALGTVGRPPGWAILQGKPFGRNHFYKGWKLARDGKRRNHEGFHWKSSVILSPVELAQLAEDLDPQSYRQEVEASFETWSGVVYSTFGEHNYRAVEWNPDRPLAFAWDFGTSPGTVVVAQIHDVPATHCSFCGTVRPLGIADGDSWRCTLCRDTAYAEVPVLCVIDEAYQAIGSTTRALCEILVQKWAERVKPGTPVHLYGDPAGFSGNTQNRSSDWDTIVAHLGRYFPLKLNVRHAQPPQRLRVNTLLRLCQSFSGHVRLFVNRELAPHTWDDFENTMLKADGSGDIDKKAAGGLYSHLSDALSYLAIEEFPLRNREAEMDLAAT